jgi:hypothetical protein
MANPIRFGFQLSSSLEADPIAAARRAEKLGFDTFLVSDHVGPGRAPMPTLAAVALLGHAGGHADIVGLQGLGRTHADGHRHDVKWTAAHLDTQIEQVKAGAGERFGEIELNAMVQIVDTSSRHEKTLAAICEELQLSANDVQQIPYVLVGAVDDVIAKIIACRERWGSRTSPFASLTASLRSSMRSVGPDLAWARAAWNA